MSRVIVNFGGIIAAVAFASLLSMGSATAAVAYTSNNTCALTDMSATADQCFGSIDPNGNDSELSLNTDSFGGVTGLFGHTDWDFLTKQETPPKSGDPAVTGTDVGLNVDPGDGTASSGTWSVNSGALDTFARVVLILKAGPTFSAYLYEPGSGAGSSGTWATSALEDKNLSHFSIYTSGVSPIPVPAAVWLFGTALIGFIGYSRRTRV